MNPHISLPAALLISLNIMLGSGLFINTVILSRTAAAASGIAYLLGGICILPLIVVLARLMKKNNGGTFYEFGASIHPLVGFIASWGYFTAKLASAALSIHVFVTLTQLLIPQLSAINTLFFDTIIIFLFVLLNLMNVRIGTIVQYGFLGIKMIPLLLMIIGALIVGGFDMLGTITEEHLAQLGSTLPFVLFALSGFEASCSLSKSLQNPEQNGPRAIWGSYLIALTLLILYQSAAYILIASNLSLIPSFKEAFPFIATRMSESLFINRILTIAFFIGVAPSALGASYGILFSNGWNLHTLMTANRLPGRSYFLIKNRYGIPLFCFIAEGCIALIYVWLFKGAQIPLQHMSALGSATAYGISCLAYISHHRRSPYWAIAGIISVSIMIGFTIQSAMQYGATGALAHTIVLAVGTCISYLYTNRSIRLP